MKKNVLTIATGKQLYIDLAVNLARSFILWHPVSDINFQLVTDEKKLIPDDIRNKVEIIEIAKGQLGEGFSPKLYLDLVSTEGQTLFIDSDCLIYGNLLPVFDKFKGLSVSVIGNYISHGDWFGDIRSICQKFQLPHIPKFNGGVYYLEKGAVATKVYETARELETQYDEIGFTRLRNRPNDEVIMALAMQLHDQAPILEDGSIMAEFVNFQSGIKSDIINGHAELLNIPGHKNYQSNWPLTKAKPLIVHFLGFHNRVYPYIAEERILQYVVKKNYSPPIAKLLTTVEVTGPWLIINSLKKIFRPVYRMVFGTRKIQQSERVIE